MSTLLPVSNFSHIYHHALQSQLRKMGSNFRSLRLKRKEDITTVAIAVNLRPEILEQIENGQRDFRIATLYDLSDYYGVNVQSILNQGELINFKIQ